MALGLDMERLKKKGYVRIHALLWANTLVSYALFAMQTYLTDVWKLSFTHASGIMNIWGGISKPDEVVPMAAFWLFFPFFLLAGLDSFFKKGVDAFYKIESLESMRRYWGHFTDTVSGLGLMYSVICVYVVGKISERGGRQSWFQDSLNNSRLDRYYLMLAGLSALNLIIFIPLASICQKYLQPRETCEEVVEDEYYDND
ncbi:hypothetical protein ACS0TY_015513 [Phlomoides rotata]